MLMHVHTPPHSTFECVCAHTRCACACMRKDLGEGGERESSSLVCVHGETVYMLVGASLMSPTQCARTHVRVCVCVCV